MSLIQEKVSQAVEILREQELDLWLTFVSETSAMRDPALDLLLGPRDLTWPSAVMITRSGRRLAIVGNLEKITLERMGVYDTVLGYDTSFRELLRDTLSELDPQTIGINSSRNSVHADGLTHGMYEILQDALQGTPYGTRLVSAERLIGALRGRKTPTELERIRKAVEITEEIFKETFEQIRGQGHIVRALTNAISSGRIAHAYLFTGIRGVGKTSVARILAKSLNCENSPEPTPTPCKDCLDSGSGCCSTCPG